MKLELAFNSGDLNKKLDLRSGENFLLLPLKLFYIEIRLLLDFNRLFSFNSKSHLIKK